MFYRSKMKMPQILKMALPWVIFMPYLLFSTVRSSENNAVFFSDNGTSKFNHLAIHRDQGTVFIGAVNCLYKLSSNLTQLRNVKTAVSNEQKNNKILVINYRDSQLIVCGSDDEFVCETYIFNGNSLERTIISPVEIPGVERHSADSSTVAFISKISQDEKGGIQLYFAISYDLYSKNLPAATMKILTPGVNFTIYTVKSILNSTSNIEYREAYSVHYVHGFESGKYKYFLITLKNSSSPASYTSKVIRICHNERTLQHGYIEIPIECKDGESLYNSIQAANVGKPNVQLAASLNISQGDDVLFAIFSKSQTTNATSTDSSALCIYSINAINEKINENVCSCFNGTECEEFKAIKPPHRQCSNYFQKVESNFCLLTMNMSLEDIIPIIEHPVVTFNTISTAIMTKVSETYNDVFIGTSTGHLKKIIVLNTTIVCEHADLPIDEGSPVNSDLLFSPKNDSLYIMTDHKLAKIELPVSVINCSIHENYNSCVHQNTPKLCGWCGLTNKCTTRCDCSYAEYYAWYPNNLDKAVLVTLSSTIVFQTGTTKSLLWGRSKFSAIWQQFTCEFIIENKSLYYSGEKLFVENKKENNFSFYNLSCPVPDINDVSLIPMGRNYLDGILSISTPQISNITKMNITMIFNCSVYTSLEECTSTLACDWHPNKQKCESHIPKIIEFSPKQGPTYGGTVLTFKGENFMIEKSINVSIGNTSCLVFIFNSQEIKCITGSSIEKEGEIIIKLDGRNLSFLDNIFTYIKDQHHDKKGFNIQPKGILDGGVKIMIQNISYKSLRGISFHVFDGIRQFNSSCNYIRNELVVVCRSPQIKSMDNLTIDAEHPRSMEFSLTDDANGANITNTKNQPFLLYPNPKFHYFVNSSVQFDGSEFIIIHGADINNACQVTDLLVGVGNHKCEVKSISSDEVVCRLLEKQSVEVEYVNVSIGKYFKAAVPKNRTERNSNPNPNPAPNNDSDQNSDLITNSNFNSNSKNSSISIFIQCAAIFSVLAVSLLIAYHFFYRRSSTKLPRQSNEINMEAITSGKCIKRVVIENQINPDEKSLSTQTLPNVAIENTSTTRFSQTHYLLPVDNKWEFPRSRLILGKCIGEGEFGKVVLGEALGILPEFSTMTVAVKMLKDNSSDLDMIDLVSEMEIMKSIGTHDNVLRLLGCCTKDGSLLIITEFACHGNLRDFLRNQITSGDNSQPLSVLSVKNLLNFALQIAEGMDYLSARKCIHRDLAARNILVSEDYIMKINNFGLPRDIQNEDFCQKNSDGRLSKKWMAPEALCHSNFSAESDVWSYGILLWEIFTLGGEPYPSLTDMAKLYQALHSGYRMEKPPHCFDEMYDLMRKCWSFIPDGRPFFSEIVEDLEEISSKDELIEQSNLHWADIQEFNNTMVLYLKNI